jgi:NTE family protein
MSKKRALVLGGGGPVGIAWEAGLLAGLSEAGVDLAQADFILGTSAGSFVGAQLAMGRTPSTLAEAILVEANAPADPANPLSQVLARPPDFSVLITKMIEAISGVRPAQEVRKEIGEFALGTQTIDEETFVTNFGRSMSEFPEDRWPARPYACTAIDTADGSFTLWNKESRVGLARAIASSCSVPGIFPPITIRGRRYMDGGMRSPTNADLAKGYDTVVVVAVRGAVVMPEIAERFQRLLDTELQSLRDGGARVELIVPDAACVESFGLNLMDPSRRAGAATTGIAQGKVDADRLRSIWD